MLIDDLYTYRLKEHSEGSIEAIVSIRRNSRIYQGHFPGVPVTPGVCQVLMLREILEQELAVPLRLSTAKRIKFTAMHEPEREREIGASIRYISEGKEVRAEGSLFNNGKVYIKFSGKFIRQS